MSSMTPVYTGICIRVSVKLKATARLSNCEQIMVDRIDLISMYSFDDDTQNNRFLMYAYVITCNSNEGRVCDGLYEEQRTVNSQT